MATNADKQSTSEVIGSILSIELEHQPTIDVTSAELAERISEPVEEVETVMARMADAEQVPVSGRDGEWTVKR